jgi:hypothetical protein
MEVGYKLVSRKLEFALSLFIAILTVTTVF